MPFVRENYTNITSEEHDCEPSNSEWGSGRDIAYLVFSILQFITTCLVWANWIVKKREEKHQKSRSKKEEREKQERLEREEREKKERLEREERDKIAEIVSSEYTSIENEGVHERLRQCKERFGSMIIFCGTTCTVTGLDILKYMLHPDKFKHYEDSKELQYLLRDLDSVVKLFQIFRIKLPPNGFCPENIREELGPPVIELGQIASAFVSGKKYYTISKVLEYFDANQQTTSLEEKYQKDDEHIRKINAHIPYVAYLYFGVLRLFQQLNSSSSPSYDVTEDFELNYMEGMLDAPQRQILHDLITIGFPLKRKEKPVDAEKLRPFVGRMEDIWRKEFHELAIPDFRTSSEEDISLLRANILHAVRVIWVKIADGAAVDPFKELVKEMEEIKYVNAVEAKKESCKRILKVCLEEILQRLEKKQQTNLPELKELDSILERLNKMF